MACSGCRRNKSNSNGSRVNRVDTTIPNQNINPIINQGKPISSSDDKYKKCIACPFREGKGALLKCTKSGTFFTKILSDNSIKCPVGKF